jgi:cytidyltransferase-like protein
MRIAVVTGKFDLLHAGHVDHIKKAAQLGDWLIIITHEDDIVALSSDKKFCAVPLWARVDILRGLVALYKKGYGEVVVASDPTGESTNTLRVIRQKYPIYAHDITLYKGGSRTDASKMPSKEVAVCQELGITIEYGVGDLLSSSSTLAKRIAETH